NTAQRLTQPDVDGEVRPKSKTPWHDMRAIDNPTPADALAITRALRTHGGMDGRPLANRSKASAVPLKRIADHAEKTPSQTFEISRSAPFRNAADRVS